MKIKYLTRFLYWALLIMLYLPVDALPATLPFNTKPAQGFIDIHVKYRQARPGDTLTLAIENMFYGDAGIEHNNLGICRAIESNGIFNFHVPVYQQYGYFTIITQRVSTKRGWATNIMPLIQPCFWQKGDNVSIQLSHKETAAGTYSKCFFSGHGAGKYTIAQLADSLLNATVIVDPKPAFDSLYNFSDFFNEKCKPAINKLNQARHLLDEFSYQILKANILYASASGRFNLITEYYDKNIRNGPIAVKEIFRQKVNNTFLSGEQTAFQEAALLNSINYIRYTYYKFRALSYINNDKDDQKLVYNLMKQKLTGRIRDREWVYLFVNYFMSTSLPELYADAERNMQDPLSKNTLAVLLKAAPGKPFYNFTLQDVNGKNISLSDFKGKTVLIDFWFYGCGGCAQFYQNVLKKVERELKADSTIIIVSINSDISKQRWVKGINEGIYTSDSAINLYTNGLGASHPLILANNVTTFPFAVLIDGKGIIRQLNSTGLFNYEELSTLLKSRGE